MQAADRLRLGEVFMSSLFWLDSCSQGWHRGRQPGPQLLGPQVMCRDEYVTGSACHLNECNANDPLDLGMTGKQQMWGLWGFFSPFSTTDIIWSDSRVFRLKSTYSRGKIEFCSLMENRWNAIWLYAVISTPCLIAFSVSSWVKGITFWREGWFRLSSNAGMVQISVNCPRRTRAESL